jgi:hypothetical protein
VSRSEEIRAIKALGERIGYGNIMSIASGLWAVMLEDSYGIDSGAFVPTVIPLLKEDERERVISEQAYMKAHIRHELKEA